MSYNFKEICNFKKGETYWESGQYGSVKFTLKDDPVVTGDQVRFVGVTDQGDELDYLVTEGLEHYGPSIYDSKMYLTLTELQEEIQKELHRTHNVPKDLL